MLTPSEVCFKSQTYSLLIATMENGFDLFGTREKRILNCSPNYGCFNLNIFIVSQLHRPLLYYIYISLLAGLFF